MLRSFGERQAIGGLAFNTTGELFIIAGGSAGHVYKFAPDGSRTTFASALSYPVDLAFSPTGDLFVSEFGAAPYIYQFAPDGTRTGFTSTVAAQALAFQPLPVPEPSTLAIAGILVCVFALRRNLPR